MPRVIYWIRSAVHSDALFLLLEPSRNDISTFPLIQKQITCRAFIRYFLKRVVWHVITYYVTRCSVKCDTLQRVLRHVLTCCVTRCIVSCDTLHRVLWHVASVVWHVASVVWHVASCLVTRCICCVTRCSVPCDTFMTWENLHIITWLNILR